MTREDAELFWRACENSWKDPRIPQVQYDLAVQNELIAYKNGAACRVFSAFIDCLLQLPAELDKPETSFLDVGASSAYYSEVMRLAGFKMSYAALDYSTSFKELANKLYPGQPFFVGDARKMPFDDESYDIVAPSCVIQTIFDWDKVLKEAARVTKKYVLLHRVPVANNGEMSYHRHPSYGSMGLRIFFDEKKLMNVLMEQKLFSIYRIQIEKDVNPEGAVHYSYLLEKS